MTYYIVQAFGSSSFYTNKLEEAEEIYFESCQSTEFVQLLEVSQRHVKTLRQSW